MTKKIVIKNFKNKQDESPNIIDIDNETGEVRQISRNHDARTLKTFITDARQNILNTFLPNGYPESVSKQYMTFTLASNVGGVAFIIMNLLSM